LNFTFFETRTRRRYLHWVFEAKKRFGLPVLNNSLRDPLKTFKPFNRETRSKAFSGFSGVRAWPNAPTTWPGAERGEK
jgi:hypothetical protein